jgi:hypothetical protein
MTTLHSGQRGKLVELIDQQHAKKEMELGDAGESSKL